MKILLMYNLEAGNQSFPLDETVSALENHGAEIMYQNTKKKDYFKALKNSYDFILIAGGDGTVGKIIKRIADKPIPVAILPFGSANNVANSLNIDQALEKVIVNWEKNNLGTFRLGLADLGKKKIIFLESVGWGLFSQVLSEKKKKKSKKNAGDKVEKGINKMLEKIADLKASYYEVFLDGLDYSGNYLWIEIMNTQVMGPKLAIAPEARHADNYLNIVLVKEDEREKLTQFLLDRKESREDVFFEPLKAKSIKIGSEEHIHVDSDVYPAKKLKLKSGELLEISLHPETLQIINSNKD